MNNVYLIEMNGGPESDCNGRDDLNECFDYTFDDIAYEFWPTAVGGVLEYSNQDKVHYVGAPIALNDDTAFTYLAREYGNSGLENIKDDNHIYLSQYSHPIRRELFNNYFQDSLKNPEFTKTLISLNIWLYIGIWLQINIHCHKIQ